MQQSQKFLKNKKEKKRDSIFIKNTSDFNQSMSLDCFTELDPDPTVRSILDAAD